MDSDLRPALRKIAEDGFVVGCCTLSVREADELAEEITAAIAAMQQGEPVAGEGVERVDAEAANRWFGFKEGQRLSEVEKGEYLKFALFIARHRREGIAAMQGRGG